MKKGRRDGKQAAQAYLLLQYVGDAADLNKLNFGLIDARLEE